MSKVSILTKNITWLYFGKIISQAFSIIVSVLIIKKLSVEDYGTFNLLVGTLVVFEVFGSSSIKMIFSRYIPELVQTNYFSSLKKIIIVGLSISSVFIILLFSLTFIFQNKFAVFFHIDNFSDYLIFFCIYALFGYFSKLIISISSSLLLHKYLSITEIIKSILSIIIYLYFLPVLTVSLMLLIGSFLFLFIIISNSITIIVYYKRLKDNRETPKKDFNWKRVVRFGLFSTANELGAGIVGKTSDYFIISALSNTYFLGLYAFAYKIYGIVFRLLPLEDIRSVLRPIFIQKFTVSYKKEEFIRTFNFIIKLMLPVHFLPAIYFFIFGKSIIIYLFDSKYIDAFGITNIILFGNIIMAFFYPVNLAAHLKERMDIMLYSKIVVIFSIIAGIYAMKYFGINGVALVTITGNFFKNFLIYLFMKTKADIVYRKKGYLNFVFIIIILLILFKWTSYIIVNVYWLILFSLIFFIMFCFLLIIFNPFTKYEINKLKEISNSSLIFKEIQTVVLFISNFKKSLNLFK